MAHGVGPPDGVGRGTRLSNASRASRRGGGRSACCEPAAMRRRSPRHPGGCFTWRACGAHDAFMATRRSVALAIPTSAIRDPPSAQVSAIMRAWAPGATGMAPRYQCRSRARASASTAPSSPRRAATRRPSPSRPPAAAAARRRVEQARAAAAGSQRKRRHHSALRRRASQMIFRWVARSFRGSARCATPSSPLDLIWLVSDWGSDLVDSYRTSTGGGGEKAGGKS